MRIVSASDRGFKDAVRKVTARSNLQAGQVESAVRTILKAVERGGDAAVSRYTRKFDRVSLKPAHFRVNPEQVREAYYKIRKEEGDALRYAAHRIAAFHDRQKPRTQTWMCQEGGITLGQSILPLDSVGLYVPGGKAVYPSSVLMSAVPAKVAGTWKLPQGEMTLKQTFQMISGTLKRGNVVTPVTGKLNGDEISFSAGEAQYRGHVSGNSMEGSAGGNKWSATRAGK